MIRDEKREKGTPSETDAVGIVVQSGAGGSRRPRVVAFVWGDRVRPAPSLPYGRWKAVRSAA